MASEREISLIKIRNGFPPRIRLLTVDRPGDQYPQVFSLPGITELTPEMVEATRKAYDAFETYAERVSWGPKEVEIRRQVIDPIIEHMKGMDFTHPNGERRPPRVLHAGCGTARELKFLTDLGFEGVGIDISTFMLKRGSRKWKEDRRWTSSSLPFVRMDIVRMGLSPEYFDLIVCESGIRHIPTDEIPQVLRSFHQVLRIGGVLVVGFREGSGEVMATVDKVGGIRDIPITITRYSTTCSLEEAEASVRTGGFEIERTIRNPHMDRAFGVPDWLLIFGRKSA